MNVICLVPTLNLVSVVSHVHLVKLESPVLEIGSDKSLKVDEMLSMAVETAQSILDLDEVQLIKK